ncbi:MAG: hypothetical protein SNI70_10760 [Rikenellaceae bacterium]
MKRPLKALLGTIVFTIVVVVIMSLYELMSYIFDRFLDMSDQVAGIISLLLVVFVYFFIFSEKE